MSENDSAIDKDLHMRTKRIGAAYRKLKELPADRDQLCLLQAQSLVDGGLSDNDILYIIDGWRSAIHYGMTESNNI